MPGKNFAHAETLDVLERLEGWSKRLREDKSLPWVGMGLIKDIDSAMELLRDKHIGQTIAASMDFDL